MELRESPDERRLFLLFSRGISLGGQGSRSRRIALPSLSPAGLGPCELLGDHHPGIPPVRGGAPERRRRILWRQISQGHRDRSGESPSPARTRFAARPEMPSGCRASSRALLPRPLVALGLNLCPVAHGVPRVPCFRRVPCFLPVPCFARVPETRAKHGTPWLGGTGR